MEDFETDELELAFCYHIVTQILGRGDALVPEEARFLQRSFPAEVFTRARFIGADGQYTARWHDACGEALMQLPTLPVERRLEIIASLLEATLADDVFELEEGVVIQRAARLLGLKPEEYGPLLDSLVTPEVPIETEER
ncbi:MAG TPA: hypothetical protein ENK18_02915 [Deltaproteobacteria bacterium]|nr:hypothetical protein [Deltaproteobacteria bacterium]